MHLMMREALVMTFSDALHVLASCFAVGLCSIIPLFAEIAPGRCQCANFRAPPFSSQSDIHSCSDTSIVMNERFAPRLKRPANICPLVSATIPLSTVFG
ncbi:hypothetical protein P3T22_006252 [Paraburkholderia sp. GAS348]